MTRAGMQQAVAVARLASAGTQRLDRNPVRYARIDRPLVDLPAVLATAALGALAFNPLLTSLAPLIFLSAGCALFALDVNKGTDALARRWWLLLFPAYTILTVFWSEFPALTLRYGIQLFLTVVVGILIGARISARQFILGLFIVFYGVMLVSMLSGGYRGDGIALGIFASKNAYAANISIFLLLSLAVAFDRDHGRLLRGSAVLGVVLSPYLLDQAQGMGASISALMAACLFLAVMFSARLNVRSRRAYYFLTAILIFAIGAPIVMFAHELMTMVLVALGKDPTITGRTDLWAKGFEYIAQRPFFGVGYQAFWVQGFGDAEELWEMFMIASRGGFHFHNAYISIAVELGLVGLLISTAMLYAFFLLWTYRAITVPIAENGFFAAFAMMLIGRSFVEVDVFFQFSIPTVVVVVGLVMLSKGKARVTRRYYLTPDIVHTNGAARRLASASGRPTPPTRLIIGENT